MNTKTFQGEKHHDDKEDNKHYKEMTLTSIKIKATNRLLRSL